MYFPCTASLTAFAFATSTLAYTDITHKRFMLKNIDPIVLPGRFTSHMHSFFGSDAVTKDLPTTATLQMGCPSGENPNDLSVYWIPTLYYVHNDTNKTHEEVNPAMFSTYYENINAAEMAIPPNYHAVAGNASATRQDDISEHITAMTWWCETGPEDRSTRPRAKPAAQYLQHAHPSHPAVPQRLADV